MSKKIIVLGTALLLLLAGLFFPQSAPKRSDPVVHQHLSWPGESGQTTGFDANGALTSHLPLIVLHTDGSVIPGVDPTDRRRLTCTYSIIWNEDGVNRSTDKPAQEGLVELNIRGNSSRRFAKKQYGFHLVDEKGDKVSASLLGMPEGSSWVLNGSYIDRALIRNYMLYNICDEFMGYVPRVRLCEVMITDANHRPVYQGVYSLIEKPQVDKTRLPLTPYDPQYTATSFLVQMNSHTDKYRVDHLKPDELMAYPFDLEYPDIDEITPASLDYVEQELLSFAKLLYDADYTGNWAPVEEAIDMDSFVDFYLVNEFFQNYDAGIRSTYLYRNTGGKYHLGPVWDFDGVCNNFNALHFQVSDLNLKTTYFYYYLSQCPAFVRRCVSRYEELRRGILSEEYLLDYIDSSAAYLGSAAQRNFDRWYSHSDSDFLHQIESMKEFIIDRGAWLDEHFQQVSTVLK